MQVCILNLLRVAHYIWSSTLQRLISSVAPSHGRVLVYVWAIEQDELSKRNIPQGTHSIANGEDVFVPWVMSKEPERKPQQQTLHDVSPGNGDFSSATQDEAKSSTGPQVFNRYYHMFGRGELTELVIEAATGLGLHIGSPEAPEGVTEGIEIVQDGWERSNYYIELRRWQSRSI